MNRRLSAEERALWRKVVATVRPLQGPAVADAEPSSPSPAVPNRSPVTPRPSLPAKGAGNTLDASWDRRLARGLVAPDRVVDLHGHGLAAAHALLEARLDEAIASGARLVLLVTGRSPRGEARPHGRGVIRASVGDWLAVSPHAGRIAAIRGAHPRHGGAGALYVVLRRGKSPSLQERG